jgi:hypothetical protein
MVKRSRRLFPLILVGTAIVAMAVLGRLQWRARVHIVELSCSCKPQSWVATEVWLMSSCHDERALVAIDNEAERLVARPIRGRIEGVAARGSTLAVLTRAREDDRVYVFDRDLNLIATQPLEGRVSAMAWSDDGALEIVEAAGVFELRGGELQLQPDRVQVVWRLDPRSNRLEERARLQKPALARLERIATEWDGSGWRQIWFTNFTREPGESLYVTVEEDGTTRKAGSVHLPPGSLIPGQRFRALGEVRSPSSGILFRDALRLELGSSDELWPGSGIAIHGSTKLHRCARHFVLRGDRLEAVDECDETGRIPLADGRFVQPSSDLRRLSLGDSSKSVWLRRDARTQLVLQGGARR